MNKEELVRYLRSRYDPEKPEDKENLARLYTLIHLRENGFPDIKGRLGNLFKEAFGFGLPLNEHFLTNSCIYAETFFVYVQEGRAAAFAYAQGWTVSKRMFSRWERAFEKRRKKALIKFLRNPLAELEQEALEPGEARVPLLILTQEDFETELYQQKLEPLIKTVRTQGLKSIYPAGFLDFTSQENVVWAGSSPAYGHYLRTRQRQWRDRG
ncbi:MAG: hypothetical protein V1743_07515 [Nanoarchaeota archaeon]